MFSRITALAAPALLLAGGLGAQTTELDDRLAAMAESLRSKAMELQQLHLAMMPLQPPDPQAVPEPPPAPPAPPAVRMMMPGGSYLGVGVQEVTANRAKELKLNEERGVEVTNVSEGSPAEKAGMKKGDVVLEYQGQRVEGTEQFVRFVRETPAGRNVKMLVSRNGQNQTITATIGNRGKARGREFSFSGEFPRMEVWIPDTPRPNMSWRSSMLGVEAEALDGQLAQYFGVKQGVLVRSVSKGSAAEKAGLKAGDVITKVDQTTVDTPRELTEAIRAERNRKSVPLHLMREKKETAVTVTLDDDEQSQGERRAPARSVRRQDYQ